MKVATASLNQTPLDWNRNLDNIRRTLEWARAQDTMVVCLPELCITGVGCGPHFKRPAVVQKSLDLLFELLPELKGMIVTLGLPLEYESHLFNAVCLVVDGKPFGFQCKTNFSRSDLREFEWFRPWARHQHVPFELNDETYKLGDMSFEFKLNEDKTFHVAVEVGEPDWARIETPAAGERQKLDLLLNPCASHFTFEKHAARLRYAGAMTEKFDYIHVFSNLVGNESGPTIYDGGSFVAEKGKILASTPRFSWHDAQAVTAVLGQEPSKPASADSCGKEDEFARAVSLGLFDYLRKSGAKGFALSLSGGADSTAVAALIDLGVRSAWEELGREAFCREFACVPGLETATNPKEAVGKILVCLYQATRNSSDATRQAARTVASEIGAEYHELDIQPIVDQYLSTVAKAIGYEPDWETDDTAMQNIQARSRVPSAWLVANLRQALLLATGNRSEATLGYTTMDGDTCGCLAPLGGIDKAFLRDWLIWLEKTGLRIGSEQVVLPFLSVVNTQKPTAELRPPDCGQTDEDDLMPYPILNRIEQLGLKQGKPVAEILDALRTEFPDHDTETLTLWIERFFRLHRRNQWKRTRYAMSFHVDDSSMSAEQSRRFPILSGPILTGGGE